MQRSNPAIQNTKSTEILENIYIIPTPFLADI
jgi:hypothetical protein